jgi:cell division protein FtsW
MKKRGFPDKVLEILIGILAVGGFLIFISASLGLLARGTVSVMSVIGNQFILGLVLGTAALLLTKRIPYTLYRNYAPFFYVGGIILTAAVFIPGIGFATKGAARWIDLGFTTFQPSELMKYCIVLASAAYLSGFGKEVQRSTYYAVGGFFGILAIPALILYLQPNIDMLLIISASVALVFFVAHIRWIDIGIVMLAAILALGVMIAAKPHAMARITSFMNPTEDVLGKGYQANQSLIAVGSGGIFGRGFGQSVQKFGYLPEPIGDSIFAVFAEEFGFVGSILLLFVFLAFGLRGVQVSVRAPDLFGMYLGLGITFLIVLQSFVNIAIIVGVLPYSGNPLIFVSHGGSALLISLAAAGVLLNISRSTRRG